MSHKCPACNKEFDSFEAYAEHERERTGRPVLPVCNFCEASYDPYDRHTCAGNNIEPKRYADGGMLPPSGIGLIGEQSCELPDWAATYRGGLSRQQIGEALDAERAARNREERDDMAETYKALANQVGGDHYRQMKIQPVEYIVANQVPFLAANIIKYASRYKAKGGAEDVRKIIHYCKLILEFEYGEKS